MSLSVVAMYVGAYVGVGIVVSTLHELLGAPLSLSKDLEEAGIAVFLWPVILVVSGVLLAGLVLFCLCSAFGWLISSSVGKVVKKAARR